MIKKTYKIMGLVLVAFFFFYIFNKGCHLYLEGSGYVLDRLSFMIDGIEKELLETNLYLGKTEVICGLIGAGIFGMFLLYKSMPDYEKMKGIEMGSAKWGTDKDIKPYVDKKYEENIILTATESLSINTNYKDFEHDRNKNVLVIGGSGSGKTRGYVKPNIMQMHSSYIITDPKGTVLPETADMLMEHGYRIKVFNTINFDKSMGYNPFAYIHSEKDILKVVNVFIENTKGDGEKSAEDFWIKAERLFYQALIGYIYYECAQDEKNMSILVSLVGESRVISKNPNDKNMVDMFFDELEKKKPDSFPVMQYKKFKLAAGETLQSILISCAARLAPFDIAEVQKITKSDELELDTIGDEKTAFFIIVSDTDMTYNFLVAMMYYQMFDLLCFKADDVYGGQLPVPVRCILDEFANLGKIPGFDKLIATIRSRGISASIILQSISQLEAVYDKSAEVIIDNCDTLLFLGGKSSKTNKNIAEMIGKITIDNTSMNESRGTNGNWSLNHQITGRELITADEVGRLKRSECLLMITGERPFKSKKYDISKHKRYKELRDAKAGRFDLASIYEGEVKAFFHDVKDLETFDASELNEL